MANSIELEFFYDCSSPWTYFGFTPIIPMMERLNLPIRWRPILVGGVFNAVNQQVYSAREAMFTNADNKRRLDYYLKDLNDWAREGGVVAIIPPGHPINSVKAMRGAFYAQEQGLIVPYSRAVFEAYWGGVNPDVSKDEVLADINGREFLMLALLAVAVLFMGLYPKPFTDAMNVSVTELLRHVAAPKLN